MYMKLMVEIKLVHEPYWCECGMLKKACLDLGKTCETLVRFWAFNWLTNAHQSFFLMSDIYYDYISLELVLNHLRLHWCIQLYKHDRGNRIKTTLPK